MKNYVIIFIIFLAGCATEHGVIPAAALAPILLTASELGLLSRSGYYRPANSSDLEYAKAAYFNSGNLEATYRLLENGLISEDDEVKSKYVAFLKERPEILEAAQNTFSIEEIAETVSRHKDKAKDIEEKRLQIYKTVASETRYQKAQENYHFVFSGKYKDLIIEDDLFDDY